MSHPLATNLCRWKIAAAAKNLLVIEEGSQGVDKGAEVHSSAVEASSNSSDATEEKERHMTTEEREHIEHRQRATEAAKRRRMDVSPANLENEAALRRRMEESLPRRTAADQTKRRSYLLHRGQRIPLQGSADFVKSTLLLSSGPTPDPSNEAEPNWGIAQYIQRLTDAEEARMRRFQERSSAS